MLVIRRVLDQFCADNRIPLSDPLAIAAAQELLRSWQAGDPTEEELALDLARRMGLQVGARSGGGERASFAA